jgi:hypothetical protein
MISAPRRAGALALLGFGAFAAAPAEATGSLACSAIDGSGASVEMNVTLSPVEAPLWIRVSLKDELWSSLPDDNATQVAISQAFSDATELSVDVADEQAERIVASLRVLRTEHDEARYQFGYLYLLGRGVFPVSCEGP